MKVAFEAMIKDINNKSLVSGDKATWVRLEFESSKKTEVLNDLNKLHQADKTVMIVIMDKEEADRFYKPTGNTGFQGQGKVKINSKEKKKE